MTSALFPAPVVATAGGTDPAAPLVVLLHGRGSAETEILGLAGALPAGPVYDAVRAPIAEGGGPRDGAELAIVAAVARTSHGWAAGV